MLLLTVREVLDLNIEHPEKLGAFNGKRECLYHYKGDRHCAIGIADHQKVLGDDIRLGSKNVKELAEAEYVTGDDIDLLAAVQSIHDWKVTADDGSSSLSDQVTFRLGSFAGKAEVVQELYDMTDAIVDADDLTIERYVAIMKAIRDRLPA